MNLSNLSYFKGEPEEPDTALYPQERVPEMPEMPFPEWIVPPGYSKPEGILSTSLLFIISGGTNTEYNFFKVLIKTTKIRSLRVIFKSKEGQGLQPYQMQNLLKDILHNRQLEFEGNVYHLEEKDKMFLLTDVDEYFDQLKNIFEKGEAKDKERWIVSNPCFEMWIYYCSLNDPEHDLDWLRKVDVSKRSQELKRAGNKLVKGGWNAIRAFDKMKEGIDHSLKHFHTDAYGIPELFSTKMHAVAQYILDIISQTNRNEYDEYIKHKMK